MKAFHSEEISRLARSLSSSSASGKAKVHCPLCDPAKSRSRSLDINFLSGTWHCWRDICGKHGRIDNDLYSHWLRKDPSEQKLNPLEPPKGFYLLSKVKDSLVAKPALDFLAKRGIAEEQWTEAGFGVVLEGYYYGRIVMPIRAQDNTWLGWIGRVWTEKPAEGVQKYLYPRGMKRGEFLYNEEAIYRSTDLPCFVVEGALDTHHLWPHAAAVLGKHGRHHIELLQGSERPICVLYDGDYWRGSFQLAYKLRLNGVRAGWLKLPPKSDPDKISPQKLMDAAIKAVWASSKEFFGQFHEAPIS